MICKLTVIKRFPGIGERPRERPVYGRDALFMAERLRKEFWANHKNREELRVYKERLVKNQKRAEGVNEVRRIQGFRESNLAYGPRLAYLEDRQKS